MTKKVAGALPFVTARDQFCGRCLVYQARQKGLKMKRIENCRKTDRSVFPLPPRGGAGLGSIHSRGRLDGLFSWLILADL